MIEKTGNELVVITAQPQELVEGQNALILRVKEKETDADADLDSAKQLLDSCEAFDMNVAHAKRLMLRAKSRKLYLTKVREALEAGYVIVPNFPSTTIAIRVKREKPIAKTTDIRQYRHNVPNPTPEMLPSGEGRYVAGGSVMQQRFNDIEKDPTTGKTKELHWSVPTDFIEEIALPVEFLKPTIIQMTGKCMTRKIFDEIAVVEQMGVDPMVIGRIIDKSTKRSISFLVAWFVDTKDI